MHEALSRRAFLARGAAAAAGIAAGCLPTTTTRAGAGPARVVVVGAGLAGLSAALALVADGHEVVVLEAGNVPGGRVATLRAPFASPLYAEAGGMFFADGHVLTKGYAERYGLPLTPIGARDLATFYYVRGQRIVLRGEDGPAWPVALTAAERRSGLFAIARRYVAADVQRVRAALEAGWGADAAVPPALAPYDALSFADLLRRNGASEAAVALIRLGYLDQWGDGVDSISALYHLRDKALLHGAGSWHALAGGNDRLPAAMAAQLGARVTYGARVTRVDHGPRGVRVAFERGGRGETLSASRVVLAVPFSVLRQVAFSPALPADKRAAIARLSHTSIARVYLQYRTRAWADATPLAWGATDLPIMSIREPTFNQGGTRGILESVMSGPVARRVTAMAPDERVAFARGHMEAVFPEARGEFERGASKCWDEDPLARGDYAWYRPGEMGSLAPAVPRAEGRLHFVGDHTSHRPGWMQGALESGLRGAAEVTRGA